MTSRWWPPPRGAGIVETLATDSPATRLGHARSALDLFPVFASSADQTEFDALPQNFRNMTVDVHPATVDDHEVRELVHRRPRLPGHLAGQSLLAAWGEPVTAFPPLRPGQERL